MAEVYKPLGQVAPLAATLTDAYTVPGFTSAVLSSIVVTNQGADETTIRLSVAIAGAADSTEQYIVYDMLIDANDTKTFQFGIALSGADVLRVYATLATVSFNIFGLEIT